MLPRQWVWTFENDQNTAELLGEYEGSDSEGFVVYYRVGDLCHRAPADCVVVTDGRKP